MFAFGGGSYGQLGHNSFNHEYNPRKVRRHSVLARLKLMHKAVVLGMLVFIQLIVVPLLTGGRIDGQYSDADNMWTVCTKFLFLVAIMAATNR